MPGVVPSDWLPILCLPFFFFATKVAIEAGRQFDECYGLAYAQQLKNKDIPEGGSKAVVLVDTTNSTVQ